MFEGKIVEERSKAELFELFGGWDEEVRQLIQVGLILRSNNNEVNTLLL